MSKYQEPSDELLNFFRTVKEGQLIPEFINFTLLHTPKQKDPIKIGKAQDIVKHLNSIDVFIYINEDLFDMLDEPMKIIAIEEKLAQVFYDNDKGTLVLLKPDIITFSGIINKYGKDYFNFFETIKLLKQQQAEKEAEAKAAAKESKKGKKK